MSPSRNRTGQRLVIMGAGGFAREIADVVRDLGHSGGVELLGFVDRDDSHAGQILNDTPILGTIMQVDRSQPVHGIAGAGEIAPRKRQVAEMQQHGIEPLTLIHPSVVMSPFVTVGVGTVITAGTILTNNIVVGDHVILNLGVTVGHDVTIGTHCVLSPGVHISGWCTIEDDCYFGTGSVVLPRVTVGRGATVGAGAVVTKNVEPGVTVVGIPARPLSTSRS
ncbi:MAG: hypothetical protein CVT67_01725 [Actinobacteria bacterium HGW-Actinobacteria-7]|nr:MAG: hypothetical protein CVT67_01725 [Actinobacteria bacterium HGW-Actinobacteria-7]